IFKKMSPNTGPPIKDGILIGNNFISRSALEKDIRMILLAYQRKQHHDFTTFKNLWNEYKFTYIHFACPEKSGRPFFMQVLYQITLRFLLQTSLLEVKLAVLYTLYLLYFTQPDNFEKIRIRLSLQQLFEYVAVVDPCNDYGKIVKEKRKDNSIHDTLDDIRTEFNTEIMEELDGNNNDNILNQLNQISNEYYTKKHKLQDTNEAIDSSKKVVRYMTTTMLQHSSSPANDVWTLVSPFSSSNEHFVKNIKSNIDQFEKDRRKFLDLNTKNFDIISNNELADDENEKDG
ncbi:8650_t:CDS:2, partial [Entrophospora sp. SA101]